MLNIFASDLFSEIALTDAINDVPFIPGQATLAVDWQEKGVDTTSILIESRNGVLGIVNPTPRGGPGLSVPKSYRTGMNVTIPHYQVDDGILADEVQGKREFGQEASLMSVQKYVADRLAEIANNNMDPTFEFQRLGALKGLILNGDGTTLLDLFAAFGVTQEAEVDMNLDAVTDTGAIRTACAAIIRKITKNLGARNFGGVKALCSPEFFDALISNIEVRATYKNWTAAAELRNGYVYAPFPFGGILWEEYRGADTIAVAANKAHIFPVGVPGLYKTVFAPADYYDAVNTVGLPRYAKQWLRDDEKGWHLQAQSNALSYCIKPKVLMKAKTT